MKFCLSSIVFKLMSIWCKPEMTEMLRPLDGVVYAVESGGIWERPRFPIGGVTFLSNNAKRYISIFKFSHFTVSYFRILPTLILEGQSDDTWCQRPFQDLSESNTVAVRQTVPDVCPTFVFSRFTNADIYGTSKVKGYRTMLPGLTTWVILSI